MINTSVKSIKHDKQNDDGEVFFVFFHTEEVVRGLMIDLSDKYGLSEF